jgi:hypothetical protein
LLPPNDLCLDNSARQKTLHLCGVEPETSEFRSRKHVRIKREAKHPEKVKWDMAVTMTALLLFGLPCHDGSLSHTAGTSPKVCTCHLDHV